MKKFNFKEKLEVIVQVFKNMDDDHISEYTAQCSYYTILSFIPFLILLLTMIQYTNIEQQTILNIVSKIVPVSMNEMVLGIIQEAYSKSLGTISISIIFTIWSAGKGLYALTKGLQSIYKVDSEPRINLLYVRLKSIIGTVIFIIIIVIGLALLVFSKSLISIVQDNFGGLKGFTGSSRLLTEIGFIFATFIIFLLLYKCMPRRKVTFRSQVWGAAFGACALNLVSFVFSNYLDIFKGFSITYGSLTTMMLIMMWTYSCFYTLYLGAEINKLLNDAN